MFVGILVAVAIAFSAGTVVDNQFDGKIGSFILQEEEKVAAPVAPVEPVKPAKKLKK